jgi:cytochrome b561
MTFRNTDARYGSLAITLHWAMLLLIAAVYLCIEMRGYFPRGSAERNALKTWHFMLGLSVLILATARLAVHLLSSKPPISPEPARWQRIAARVVHVLLYAFMLGMPLLGWLVLGAAAKPIPFFGLQWPALTAPDPALAERLEGIHETIGNIGYALIGVHAAAALFHHALLRDDTLQRMLPWLRRA